MKIKARVRVLSATSDKGGWLMRRWFGCLYVKYSHLLNKERRRKRKLIKLWNSMHEEFAGLKSDIREREDMRGRIVNSDNMIACRSEPFTISLALWPLKEETVPEPDKKVWKVIETVLGRNYVEKNDAAAQFKKSHGNRVKTFNQSGSDISTDEPFVPPSDGSCPANLKQGGPKNQNDNSGGKQKGNNNGGNNNQNRQGKNKDYYEPDNL